MTRQKSLLEPVYGKRFTRQFYRSQKKKTRNIASKVFIGIIVAVIIFAIVTLIICTKSLSDTNKFIAKTDTFIEKMEGGR